jgi:hypothetical protein
MELDMECGELTKEKGEGVWTVKRGAQTAEKGRRAECGDCSAERREMRMEDGE